MRRIQPGYNLKFSFTGSDEETAAETDWSVTVVDAAPFAPAHVVTALLSRFYDRANNEFGMFESYMTPHPLPETQLSDPRVVINVIPKTPQRTVRLGLLTSCKPFTPRHGASDRLGMEKRKLWDILLANYLREGALLANSVFETIDLPSAATFFQLLTQGNRRRYNALAA